MMDVRDFRAVAVALAEQNVNLQAMVSALNRQLESLEAEHAKCPKPTDTPVASPVAA